MYTFSNINQTIELPSTILGNKDNADLIERHFASADETEKKQIEDTLSWIDESLSDLKPVLVSLNLGGFCLDVLQAAGSSTEEINNVIGRLYGKEISLTREELLSIFNYLMNNPSYDFKVGVTCNKLFYRIDSKYLLLFDKILTKTANILESSDENRRSS